MQDNIFLQWMLIHYPKQLHSQLIDETFLSLGLPFFSFCFLISQCPPFISEILSWTPTILQYRCFLLSSVYVSPGETRYEVLQMSGFLQGSTAVKFVMSKIPKPLADWPHIELQREQRELGCKAEGLVRGRHSDRECWNREKVVNGILAGKKSGEKERCEQSWSERRVNKDRYRLQSDQYIGQPILSADIGLSKTYCYIQILVLCNIKIQYLIKKDSMYVWQ